MNPLAGMNYYPEYFSEYLESKIVNFVDSMPWQTQLKRRTQQYGVGYDYTSKELLYNVDPIPKELDLFLCKSLIVNDYQPNQGINFHIDSHVFGSTILIVSLLSDVNMVFRFESFEQEIFLGRRSLTILSGNSRYLCQHGIPDGAPTRRISLTYRSIVETI
jgi:alkylated DNA repair dioxygenase AlkB